MSSMKERPILFNGEMVRAILNGRKTQTRRVMRPQPDITPEYSDESGTAEFYIADELVHTQKCPYGQIGDRLWVRETFATYGDDYSYVIHYRADMDSPERGKGGWKPSIFMPRIHSRITLEITDIRVERLNDISEEDAIAEGAERNICPGCDPKTKPDCCYDGTYLSYPFDPDVMPAYSATEWFCPLWESINSKPKPIKMNGVVTHYVSYPWEDVQETREHRGLPWHVFGSSWVWVIEFKKAPQPETEGVES